jgi:hypothetical protein
VHFGEFHERYSPLFQLYRKVAGEKSLEYFKGLFQAKKKNMERMAEAVPFSDDQSLQHFLTALVQLNRQKEMASKILPVKTMA